MRVLDLDLDLDNFGATLESGKKILIVAQRIQPDDMPLLLVLYFRQISKDEDN